MPLTTGSRLGPYEVLGPLGKGGMGEVYRALDTRLKRQVALKVLPASVAFDGERLARFRREAEVLASLNHPHIAAVYGFETDGGTDALVMELVDGDTLADRIARAPVPLDEVVAIARQIADALEAAHERGIVHRDLKPANIKVRDDGTVKVLDFGLAKLSDAASGAENTSDSPTLTAGAMTGVGIILGTAAYMSPEQARGKPVDKRTDVWAFGAVLYEMLTRRRAFEGEDVTETLAAVVKSTPDWGALPPDTPPHVVSLIQRCLEKDRRTRIGDIAVARFLLSEHGSATSAPTVRATTTSSTMAPASSLSQSRRERRRVFRWIVLGTIVGTIVAGVLRSTPETPSTPTASPTPVRFSLSLPPGVALSTTQSATSLAISPDGQHIAFAAVDNGVRRIWLRSLDAVEPMPLPGTDGGTQPFWSPDSRTLGFAVEGEIKTIGVPGGRIQVVTEAPAVRGASWSQDGVIIFGGIAGGIFRVPASGGPPTEVTKPDVSRGESAHRFPSFLPDGEHFLYLAFPSNTIWVDSLEGDDAEQVMATGSQAQYVSSGHLLFVRGAALLAQRFDPDDVELSGDAITITQDPVIDINGSAAFSASETGALAVRTGLVTPPTQLVWTDRRGTRLRTVGQSGRYRSPALSPDGTRIAIEMLEPRMRTQDVWILDSAGSESSRFTFDAANDIWPVWSPDGARLAFGSDRAEGKANLYVKPANGSSGEELLLELGAERLAAPLSWSPDGKSLVLRAFAPFSNLGLLSLENREFRMIHEVGFTQAQGQISPNGRWLAYHSLETGTNQIYVESFESGTAKWQVSKTGGIYPRWSRDGRELFFYALDGRINAVPISGESALTIGAPMPLFEARLLNGPSVAIGFRAQYDVSRDGRFLLNVPVEDVPPTPINVVLHWEPAQR